MNRKVIISLPHLKQGGSERATVELANYFVSQGIETVVLLMYERAKSYTLNDKVKLIEPSGRWSNLPKLLYPFFLIFYLRFHIKRENPNSVLAFGYKTYIFFACLKINVRVIDSLRTSPNRVRFPNNTFYNFVYNFVRSLLNKRIDGIIAQTIRAKSILIKKHRCEVEVIPNSVREITNYNVERENIILSVGRLSVEKGHRYLIEAFADIDFRGWRLQLLGDGPQRKNLRELSVDLGIKESVIFEGFQSDLDFYMQKAKIFVLPSLIEGFPNALVEAMANGLACVSFDCESGPSEIISHRENGILIEMKNVEMLSHCLDELIQSQATRRELGNRAKEVIYKYERSTVGQQYIDFLFKDLQC